MTMTTKILFDKFKKTGYIRAFGSGYSEIMICKNQNEIQVTYTDSEDFTDIFNFSTLAEAEKWFSDNFDDDSKWDL